MTFAASLQASLPVAKHCQVPQHLNPFSVMAYSSSTLMTTFGKTLVWMMNMMVRYHGGWVTKRYTWGFKLYSSVIGAMRRRFS
jgi:hypothetical protein